MSKRKEQERKKLETMTKYDRKKYLKADKKRKEQRKKILYGTGIAAIIIVFVGLIFAAKYSQEQIKYDTYAKIGKHEISSSEYEFFLNMHTNSWISSNYSYLQLYGIDLSSNEFLNDIKDEETGQTWLDYFKQNTNYLLERIYAIYDVAKAEKFNDYKDDYDAYIERMKQYASDNDMTFLEYIKLAFGSNMTEKDFEKYADLYTYVNAYDESLYYGFKDSITDNDISDTYNENPDYYDTVEYLMFSITGDSESDDVEKKVTNAISNINDKDSFIEQAKIYLNNDELTERNIHYVAYGINNTDSQYSEWLFDKSRKTGDVISVTGYDNSTYYILYFEDRALDEEKTVNFRVIGKMYTENPDEVTEDLLDKESTLRLIQEIADKYTLDGASEQVFIELAETSGMIDGGLNQNVTKNAILSADIKDWLFDDSREKDDIKIVEEKDVYYLIYFKEFGKPYYELDIIDTLTQEKYNAFIDEITKDTFEIVD